MIPDMDAWCRPRCAPLVVPPAAQVTTRLHHLFSLLSSKASLVSRKMHKIFFHRTTKSKSARNILLGCWDAGKQIGDGNDLRQWPDSRCG